MSTDWQKTPLAAVFADHLLSTTSYHRTTRIALRQYRIGTGLRANPVGGQGVIKLITQHVIGTNHP
ncbi:pilus assembly protein PilV [Escherichia coli]|uniref:pilus assembly protein PilV n=1 Tax=Escherichia coli TaxID=562 RepID=UPI003CEB5DAA